MAGSDHSQKEPINPDLMPAVVLANPQMGENIGASARAMKNCGLNEMHLINPRDGWPNPAAVDMASGGHDILDNASVHENTADALASFTLVAATTARRRGMAKKILTPREAAEMLIAHNRSGGRSALLFGGERSGLDNDDVALADIVITAPLNPVFSSLNLGQAVLLTGWECRMAALEGGDFKDDELVQASSEKKQFFFRTLEKSLGDGGFFASTDMQPGVMRNIMAMYNRAGLTEQDLKTLHGMLKALKRAGKKG
jgi:tRNA/rRNA methyltransferase